jgi:hypothetical protein
MKARTVQFCSLFLIFLRKFLLRKSVTGGLAVVAAVVLTAEKLAGQGVDGNALAIGPVAVLDLEVVAQGS